ncbi:DENN domain-containing protein 5A [Hondaea fermentalgiana]|uniref:DENN domain-containing protein 5A n=1 Tax=Hondaea fermentalgiana TaxID=2315210 RepID=A0A2R5GUX0_9STRA|nr:DENN domain-containing protein 5A [Hondaea fermentalgiana]|eukprot:GBG34365.1 DENN domain-containing protein 5A [Hondaea fermentalgiana]
MDTEQHDKTASQDQFLIRRENIQSTRTLHPDDIDDSEDSNEDDLVQARQGVSNRQMTQARKGSQFSAAATDVDNKNDSGEEDIHSHDVVLLNGDGIELDAPMGNGSHRRMQRELQEFEQLAATTDNLAEEMIANLSETSSESEAASDEESQQDRDSHHEVKQGSGGSGSRRRIIGDFIATELSREGDSSSYKDVDEFGQSEEVGPDDHLRNDLHSHGDANDDDDCSDDDDSEDLFSPSSAASPPFDHNENGIGSLGVEFEMQTTFVHGDAGSGNVDTDQRVRLPSASNEFFPNGTNHEQRDDIRHFDQQNDDRADINNDDDDDDDDAEAAAQEAEIIANAAAAAPSLRLMALDTTDPEFRANMRGADGGVSPRANSYARPERFGQRPGFSGPGAAGAASQMNHAAAQNAMFSSPTVKSTAKTMARKRPPTVATYFAATGVDWRRALAEGPIAKLDLLDPSFCVDLPGVIKDRFPAENYADLPLNPSLCQFCHPIGMSIRQGGAHDADLGRVQDYSFLITNEMHQMTHGTCLAFYDPVPDKIRARFVDISLDQVLKRDRARSDWITRSFSEYLAKRCATEDEMVWFKFCQQFDSIQRELGDAADQPENQSRFNTLLDGYLLHYRGPMENLMEEEYVASLAETIRVRKEADERAALAEVLEAEDHAAAEDLAAEGKGNELEVTGTLKASDDHNKTADVKEDAGADLDADSDSLPSLVSLEEARFHSAKKRTELGGGGGGGGDDNDDGASIGAISSEEEDRGEEDEEGEDTGILNGEHSPNEHLFATPLQSPMDEKATVTPGSAPPASPPTAVTEDIVNHLDDALQGEDLAVQYCREIRLAAVQTLKETFADYSAETLSRWDPYEPKTLALVSPFPFYTLYGAILREILRIVREKDALPVPLERCLQHVLLEVPEPPPGKYRVRFKLHDDMPYYFTCSKPPLNRLPLLNVPLRPLFESLGAQNLLNLFSALILEFPILLVTSRLDLLSNAISGLLALLWPLKWQSNIIPVLPSSMTGLLDSPVPILIGMHRSQLPRDRNSYSALVFVDLDENIVELPSDRELPLMPPRILKQKLWYPLRDYVYVKSGADRPIEKQKRESLGAASIRERRNSRRRRPQRYSDSSALSSGPGGELEMAASHRIVTDFLEEEPTAKLAPIVDASTEEFNNTVRRIFVEFFVTLIGDYRWYMGGLEEDGDELIDREAFLRDHKDTATSREFLNDFISTQMMQTFFDSRVFAAEHNFEIMLFDAWIDLVKEARTTPPPSVMVNATLNGDMSSSTDSSRQHTIKASFLDDTSQADRSNYDVAPPAAAEYLGAGLFRMNSRAFPDPLHWNALPEPRAVPSLIRARRGSHLLRNVDKVSHVLESVNLSFFTKQRLFRARFSLVKRYALAGLEDVRQLHGVIEGVIRHLEEYASTMDKAFRDQEGKPRTRVLNPNFEPNPYMRGSVWSAVQQEAERQVKLCRDMAKELSEKLSSKLKEVIRKLRNAYDILTSSEEKHMSNITTRKTAMEQSKKRKEIAMNEFAHIEKIFVEMQAQLQRQRLETSRTQQAFALQKYFRSATPAQRKSRRSKIRRPGFGSSADASAGASPLGPLPGRHESSTSGQTPASVGSGPASQVGGLDTFDLASPRSVQSRFGTLGSPRSEQSLRTVPRSEGSMYSSHSVASAGDLFDRNWCDDEDIGQVDDAGSLDDEEDNLSNNGDVCSSDLLRGEGDEGGSLAKDDAGNELEARRSGSGTIDVKSTLASGIFTDDVSLNIAMSGHSGSSNSSAKASGRGSGRRASTTFLGKRPIGSQRFRRRSETPGLSSIRAATTAPLESSRTLLSSHSSRDDLDNEDAVTDSSTTESRSAVDRLGGFSSPPSATPSRSGYENGSRVHHVSTSELARVLDRKVAAKRTLRAARLQFAQDVASLTRELTNFTEANSENLQTFHRTERTRIKNVKNHLKELMNILYRWMVMHRQHSFESLHVALLSPIWRTPLPQREPHSAGSDKGSSDADATEEMKSNADKDVSETSDVESHARTEAGPSTDASDPSGSQATTPPSAAPCSSPTPGEIVAQGVENARDIEYPFRDSLPSMSTRPHGTDTDREDVFAEWQEWMNGVAALYKTSHDSASYRTMAMRTLAEKVHTTVEAMGVGLAFQRKDGKLSTLQNALVRVKECMTIMASTMSNNADVMNSVLARMSEELRSLVITCSMNLNNAHEELLNRKLIAEQNVKKAEQQLAAKGLDKERVLQDLARAGQEARELQEQVVGAQESALSASSSSSSSDSDARAPASALAADGSGAGSGDGGQTRDASNVGSEPDRRASDDHAPHHQRGGLRSAVKRVLKSSDVDRLAHAHKKQERLAKKLQDYAEEETLLSSDRDAKRKALEVVTNEYRRWMEVAYAEFCALEVDRVTTSVRQLNIFVESLRAEREVVKLAITDRMEAVRKVDPQEDLRRHKDLDERTKRYLDDALDHFSRHPSMAGMIPSKTAEDSTSEAKRQGDGDETDDYEDGTGQGSASAKDRGSPEGSGTPGAEGDAETPKGGNAMVPVLDANGQRRSGRFDSVDSVSLEGRLFAVYMRRSLGTLVLRFNELKYRMKSLYKHTDGLAKSQRRATHDLEKLCAQLGHVPLNLLEQRRDADPFDDLFLKTFVSITNEMEELTELHAALSTLTMDARASKRSLNGDLLEYVRSKDNAEVDLMQARDRFTSSRDNLARVEADMNECEASMRGIEFRSRSEESRRCEKLFALRDECEKAKKAKSETEKAYIGARQVYETCFSQLLVSMQNGYTDALSSCLQYLQSFVESVQEISLGHAKKSPFMSRRSRALDTTEEPIVLEGDNDAVLDLAAMDTNGFFDSVSRLPRDTDSAHLSYSSTSTADDQRVLLTDSAPSRTFSGSRHERRMRESLRTLGGASMMASSIKQSLSPSSAVAQLSKMFTSSRHAFLRRPVLHDSPGRRERPVRCDEVETVILHSKLICESLLEVLPERLAVMKSVIGQAQDQIDRFPVLLLSKRDLMKKRKLIQSSTQGKLANGYEDSLHNGTTGADDDAGSPRSLASMDRPTRGASSRSTSTTGTTRFDSLRRPGHSIRHFRNRIRHLVPGQGSLHRSGASHRSGNAYAHSEVPAGAPLLSVSSASPSVASFTSQARSDSGEGGGNVTELDANTFGLDGASALTSILGERSEALPSGANQAGSCDGADDDDEATTDGTSSVVASVADGRSGPTKEVSTLFMAIDNVHKSWTAQVGLMMECLDASDHLLMNSLREMADTCQQYLKEINDIRMNLKRNGAVVRNALARANDKVIEARAVLDECEQKDYHRNYITQEAGTDRKQRKVGAAKRKLREAEENNMAAIDKYADFQRLYRNEAARVMRKYDNLERHQFNFLISLHERLQFWHKRLETKLQELTEVSHEALKTVDLQADVQSFVDAHKFSRPSDAPQIQDLSSLAATVPSGLENDAVGG